ncbi:putative Copper transporter [Melia azedarach]|uniref:Copper transporter n=1 Tax=Melia azedarach TaxID=155640 RepID=A0ACC1YPF2_MELAZ|nr:putative Copper transporter [Melia azedarach]
MNDGHMHDTGGMAPPPITNGTMMHHKKMMMHMTFYWGKEALVLFKGWPGTRPVMYALALIFVFVMGFLVEWLSHSRLIKPGASNVFAGVIQTFMHTIRVGLAYMVMLAVMSFNVGVFLAAVAGQALGFLVFGSRVFERADNIPPYEKASDLPPMSC